MLFLTSLDGGGGGIIMLILIFLTCVSDSVELQIELKSTLRRIKELVKISSVVLALETHSTGACYTKHPKK